jgi:hypothetical protein
VSTTITSQSSRMKVELPMAGEPGGVVHEGV